jgi:hypothetical protein
MTDSSECHNKDKVRPGFEIHDCPNMKPIKDDMCLSHEHYKCEVCGKEDHLDYEEIG